MAAESTATEHTGRGPLSMDELAAVIGRDIPAGSYVNLGIGHPTKIGDHLPTDADGRPAVILHTENGMLGMGPAAAGPMPSMPFSVCRMTAGRPSAGPWTSRSAQRTST